MRVQRVVRRSYEDKVRFRVPKAAFQCALGLSESGGEVGADTRRGWHR
jgi:hypothetical protein